MKRAITLLIAGALVALAVPAFGSHVSDGGTDEAWTNEMNQETYWEDRFGADCTQFENHNGYIPSQYDAAVVKDGNFVRVYEKAGPFTALGAVNPANDQHFAAPHSWVMKCSIEEQPEVPNLCDPADKPGGKSIGQWLAESEFEAADCFEFEVNQECGTLDAELTRNDTPYAYKFVWNYGDAPNLGEAQDFPAVFAEDEGDGSVEVTYYVVGPEADYFVGYGIPNFWDGGETVTVETDCTPPETTPPTTTPPTTAPPTTEPPVTTPPSTQPPTTQPPATTPSELPFTGPSDWLIPAAWAALGMIVIGSGAAWFFRDRLS